MHEPEDVGENLGYRPVEFGRNLLTYLRGAIEGLREGRILVPADVDAAKAIFDPIAAEQLCERSVALLELSGKSIEVRFVKLTETP